MNKDLFETLKTATEIDPDTHDGSYNLVQETVAIYARYPEVKIKKEDLLLIIRASTIQTNEKSFDQYLYGRPAVEKKQSEIIPCNLPEDEKANEKDTLSKLFHAMWERREEYENYSASKGIGMFRGDMRSCHSVTDEGAKTFIDALIEIQKQPDADDEFYFAIAEKYFQKKLHGIEAGTASQVLHCLKPSIFPVLNRIGREGYAALGVVLQEPEKMVFYIENCRHIKTFRDEHYTFRNYRVFDKMFFKFCDKINFEELIAFLDTYGGGEYRKESREGKAIKNAGERARSIFQKFCKNFVEDQNVQIKCSFWQNSSHICKYFWGQLKESQHKTKPYSVAIALEKVQGEWALIIKIEIDKTGTSEERAKFNSVALNAFRGGEYNEFIAYGGASSGGEVLTGEQAVERLLHKNYDRICPVVVLSKPYNSSRTEELLEEASMAVEALRPLYDDLLRREDSQSMQSFVTQMQKEEQKNTKFPKNLILYGPPGTGKTYNTMAYAVAIIEKKSFQDVKAEADRAYDEVMSRYDQYKEKGLIGFVTFHQSYGYEEFVQGIKPVTEEGGISYEVQNGIFKDFCEKAKGPSAEEAKDYGLNKNPTIWKVSLEGTGDNKTRTYCFDNGCIRVGFDSYGENIVEDTDFKEGGKNVLNAFINDMRVGDIVLSCYTNTTIDGVGVVTGDYEWHNEFDRYRRLRKVKWIYRGKKDIVEINGNKTMTLSTVYRLNNITLADVIKIVEGDGNEIENTSVKIPSERSNHVFIIDEINRGNISKIFGELITLIEDTKREGAREEMKVTLPYKIDGEPVSFSVPDNVYIIGTMNTADRSIAAIDTALRRRFQFEEMMPEAELLKGIQIKDQSGNDTNINVQSILQTINRRIEALYDREHTIGHAYFMPLKDGGTLEKLEDIFKTKIIPLLQEYFYDDYEKIRLVLGDNQKEGKGIPLFVKRKSILNNVLFGNTEEEFLSDNRYTYSMNPDAFKKPEAYCFIYESDKTPAEEEA